MVQIAKIRNQNLSFGRPNMPAGTKEIAKKYFSKISCQYLCLPNGTDCVRVLEKFPNGAYHSACFPADFFASKISRENPEKVMRKLLES